MRISVTISVDVPKEAVEAWEREYGPTVPVRQDIRDYITGGIEDLYGIRELILDYGGSVSYR